MTDFILNNYPWIIGITAFLIWKKWRNLKMKPLLQEYMSHGAIIVDVRSPEEFKNGHCKNSINIPLNVLEARSHELKVDQHTIVCCASGGRSAMAMSLLKSKGFTNVINAGAWTNAQSACN